MASRMRWTARVGVAALVVGVAAPAAWAATSWTPSPTADKTVGVATGQYSWNYGSSFSKLSNGKVALSFTSDATSPQGTYVRVGTVDPATKVVTWGKAKRSSQATPFADRTSLAAGGNTVHASWITQHRATINDITKPRVAYVRTLVGSTLGSPIRLSSATGRVDYPILAASGTNSYVTYTNADTGKVVVRRSTDSGASYKAAQNLGTTTRNDGEGLAAWPINCASGSNVGVVWLPGDGTIKLSVSEDNGATFATKSISAVNAGDDDEGWASCDATGDRIGITWNETGGVYYSEYNTTSNAFDTARKNIFPFSGSGYLASYSGTVALNGTGTVGIAAPLCVQDGCNYESKTTRIDLKWLESANNGDTFAAAQSLSSSTVAGKALNDSPSAMFYDENTRFVLYNGWTANYTNYRLYLSTGLS